MHAMYNLVKFRLCTFQIQQLELLQNSENATFALTSMVTLSKNYQKILQIVLISAVLKCMDEI